MEGPALEHGCAATWLTGSYDADPRHALLDDRQSRVPTTTATSAVGDNLWSNSVLALDPTTGRLRWHFQFTPHDLNDWDAVQTVVAVDAPFQGTPRKLLLQANRNGFFYVLDRETGSCCSPPRSSGISTGRPASTPTAVRSASPGMEPSWRGTIVCPSVVGATNWMAPAFNPDTGLYYVMALERCSIFQKSSRWFEQGESFYGGSTRNVPGETGGKVLRAIEIDTGRIAWEMPQVGEGDSWGGVLSTATGLLFSARTTGRSARVDARTGARLWQFAANALWRGSPMTYLAGGRQHVADRRRRQSSTRSRWRHSERSPEADAADADAGTADRRCRREGSKAGKTADACRTRDPVRADADSRRHGPILDCRCTVPRMRRAVLFAALGLLVSPLAAQGPPEYDFLIKGGRVIDPRNSLDAVRDVAIKDGKIAAVATDIAAARAMKAVDARGLVVTPGLIDIHVHVFPGEKLRDYAGGDWSVIPGRLHAAQLRDHGERRRHVGLAQFPRLQAPHHRRVEDPRHGVPQHRRQRHGLGADRAEPRRHGRRRRRPTMALKHKGVVVGIKSAHYNGTDWKPYEQAVIAGTQADIPVMIDFGGNVRRPAARSWTCS